MAALLIVTSKPGLLLGAAFAVVWNALGKTGRLTSIKISN
jgi:hypothetical protein